MTGRVLFYVQHLLGVGHLVRAARVAQAMADEKLSVDLVSGGMPVPGIQLEPARFTQLPPVRSGIGGFHDLVDRDGRQVDERWKEERRDQLLAVFYQQVPDLLMIEAFPFGRRQMRFELLPLLDAAEARTPRPLIICSVRDILQTGRKPDRDRETAHIINTRFDHVLVHGDPALVRLGNTFPNAHEIEDKVHYTGMVAGPLPEPSETNAGRGEVIIATGGGAFGRDLLFTAMEARPLSRLKDAPWRFITGPNLSDADYGLLEAQAPPDVTVERYRKDYALLLAHCEMSISHCGYNTVIDVLRAGCRSVMVPYSVGGESEQTMRATSLAERGLAKMVEDSRLTPETLYQAIDAALDAPPAKLEGLRVDGARESARLVASWVSG